VRIDHALDDVQDSTMELAHRLRLLGEHHASEADVYHLGHALARLCVEQVNRLQPVLDHYGAKPVDTDEASSASVLELMRRKASEVVGRAETAGVLLFEDLRRAYLVAQRAEIDWVALLQAARAVRDPQLITVAATAHEQIESAAKWLRARFKESAPQVLAAG